MTSQDHPWAEPPPCHICEDMAVTQTSNGPLCEGCHDGLAEDAHERRQELDREGL